MRMSRWPRRARATTLAAVLCAAAGCGGGSGSPTMAPIQVSLAPSTVVVSQDGTPTYVQIHIKSTSETALVSFAGIPGGVMITYAASDTNPSGVLTFMATAKVSAGTYMPILTVDSAGQKAMLEFTLIVPAGMMPAAVYQPST